MRAAVYYGPAGSWPQKPMVVTEVPEPRLEPDDVLVRIAACGLCRTDLEYLKGAPIPKQPPIIFGHEPSGIVAEIGTNVTNVKPGQRVLVATPIPCLSCSFCQSGRQNLCPNMMVVGATHNGAFAEYVVAPHWGVCPLPDSLPIEESSVITDAVATCYHALCNRARVRRGDTVAIFGASGGLGLICVQIATAFGAKVIGVGRKKWKLQKARELGAAEVLGLQEIEQADRAVRNLTGGGADIAIDVTGVPAMIENAFRATKPGGKVVVVGFSFEKFQLSVNRLNWLELNVIGSKNYNVRELPKVISLVERGFVKLDQIVSHRFKLEQINEAYQMLDKGEMLRGIVLL
ncbi:MAG: zinc-binding dehydrogenase [Chloroflexi bacterium]|nr:zinc-binding dehydrogenase [Chloroflexota bacterium]